MDRVKHSTRQKVLIQCHNQTSQIIRMMGLNPDLKERMTKLEEMFMSIMAAQKETNQNLQASTTRVETSVAQLAQEMRELPLKSVPKLVQVTEESKEARPRDEEKVEEKVEERAENKCEDGGGHRVKFKKGGKIKIVTKELRLITPDKCEDEGMELEKGKEKTTAEELEEEERRRIRKNRQIPYPGERKNVQEKVKDEKNLKRILDVFKKIQVNLHWLRRSLRCLYMRNFLRRSFRRSNRWK